MFTKKKIKFINIGGFNYSNRSVLSYHYYSPPDLNAKLTMKARKRDLERLSIGGMLTEFWITPRDDSLKFPESSRKI